MIAIFPDNARLQGDAAYQRGALIASGFDLQTAVYLRLMLDAPAQPGDVLPRGTPPSGYWADKILGTVTGSRLWLLRHAEPTDANARRAEQYASEALEPLIVRRLLRSVEPAGEVKRDAIWLSLVLRPMRGADLPLAPLRVTA